MTHLLKPRWITSAVALAAIAVLTVAVASAAGAGAKPKAKSLVASASTGLGRVLVDRQGRTLYLFEKDARGTSACTGPCAAYWPPLLTSGKPAAGKGVRASLLGTTKRADGTRQVTYNRHPLYTFSLDTKAGQTKGQNMSAFGGEWYVVSPAGAEIDKSAAPAATPTTPYASTAGYGY